MFLERQVTYIAYLDEFGHIGPYICRKDKKHNDSPVFGLAGLVLPISEVRRFGTWFYQRKCDLLDFEIKRSGKHPAIWEKKGASLYTAKNVSKYSELRKLTFRLLNKIQNSSGFVFYVGITKTTASELHDPNKLYKTILREAIKRLDQHCSDEYTDGADFLLALDEHDQRSSLVTEASISMYGDSRRRTLVEPPFQLESHRYQTMQAADWIAGLVGRLGASWKAPEEFPENCIFRNYFEHRLSQVAIRSGIRD